MLVDAPSCKSYCRIVKNNFRSCQSRRWSWQGWSFHPFFRFSLWVWTARLHCLHIITGKKRGRDKHRILGNTLGQRSWGGGALQRVLMKSLLESIWSGPAGGSIRCSRGWLEQSEETGTYPCGSEELLLSEKISAEWLTCRILVCPSNLLLLRVSSRFCFLWDACVESVFLKAKLMHWSYDCMFYRRK